MSWRIRLIKSYFANAWSAFTYLFSGMPEDKLSYWTEDTSPEYVAAVAAYKANPSFHNLKDVGVEWNKAWAQRGFKVTALFGCLLSVGTLCLGLLSGSLLSYLF